MENEPSLSWSRHRGAGPDQTLQGAGSRRWRELPGGSGRDLRFPRPNGAGKSTTIDMLCTLVRPTAGSAHVAGFNVITHQTQVRRQIGLVFQDPTLDDYFPANENQGFQQECYGVPGE